MTWKILSFLLLALVPAPAATILFGPTPYRSPADIPAGFYASGPTGLDDFENPIRVGLISASAGGVISGLNRTDVDSVDGDDGLIDGSGSQGRSWFVDEASTGVTFTFGVPFTAAGLVYTDSLRAQIEIEAFGPGMVSLGTYLLGPLGDGLFTGATDEDRFIGVQDAGGIQAIRIRALTAVGTSGLEVDHVQFGVAPVPEPSTVVLHSAGVALLLGFGFWRRARAAAPLAVCLVAAFAPISSPAATLVITDTGLYEWTNHDNPAGAAYATVGGPLGRRFVFDRTFAPIITIDHTYAGQTWNTATFGSVGSVRFILEDQIFSLIGPGENLTDTVFRTGSVVWNTTANQYFRSVRNGSTTNVERVDAVLTPTADYCLVGAGGACTAISGFGDGILQFGIFAEADLRNETTRFLTAIGFSPNFSITVTSAPEPSTGAMLAIAGMLLWLGFRRRSVVRLRGQSWSAPAGVLFLITISSTMPLLAQNVIRDDAAITEASSGLKSLGGAYGLRIRSGRLELYSATFGRVTWTAPTGTATVTRAVMRANGNLEVMSAGNVAWQTRTEGHPGAYLTVQTDGNLVIYSRQLKPLWSSATHRAAPQRVSQAMLPAETLFELDRPVQAGSPSNEFPPCEMVMQSDGNLVLYSLYPTRTATWSSDTPRSAARWAILQFDGNLVLYDTESRPVWSSNTHGNPRARLELTDRCTARLIDTRGRPIWDSAAR